MLNDYKPTHDPNLDTFKVEYLLGFSAILGILFPYAYRPAEVFLFIVFKGILLKLSRCSGPSQSG